MTGTGAFAAYLAKSGRGFGELDREQSVGIDAANQLPGQFPDTSGVGTHEAWERQFSSAEQPCDGFVGDRDRRR